MRHGNKKIPSKVVAGEPFSYRVPEKLAPSFQDVVTVSRRTKASIMHESLEVQLPAMETRYAPQLKKLRSKKVRPMEQPKVKAAKAA